MYTGLLSAVVVEVVVRTRYLLAGSSDRSLRQTAVAVAAGPDLYHSYTHYVHCFHSHMRAAVVVKLNVCHSCGRVVRWTRSHMMAAVAAEFDCLHSSYSDCIRVMGRNCHRLALPI